MISGTDIIALSGSIAFQAKDVRTSDSKEIKCQECGKLLDTKINGFFSYGPFRCPECQEKYEQEIERLDKIRYGDIEKMSIEDFWEYCKLKDDNILKTWDKDKFSITCKCSSTNIFVIDNLYSEGESGCPTCGPSSSLQGKMLIKCGDCGNAMTIINHG